MNLQALTQGNLGGGDRFNKLYWINQGNWGACGYSKFCKTARNCFHSYNNISSYQAWEVLLILIGNQNITSRCSSCLPCPSWVLHLLGVCNRPRSDCVTYLPLPKPFSVLGPDLYPSRVIEFSIFEIFGVILFLIYCLNDCTSNKKQNP